MSQNYDSSCSGVGYVISLSMVVGFVGFVLYKITPLRALPLSGAVLSGGNSGKLFIDGEATAQTSLFGLVWFDASNTDNPNVVRLNLTNAFWCFL